MCSCLSILPFHGICSPPAMPSSGSRQPQILWAGSFPSALHSLQELAMVSPCALSHSAVPGRGASGGTGRAWWDTDCCALLNRGATAAATVPAPRQELLPSSGGGAGQHPPVPELPAEPQHGLPCPSCCTQTMCVGWGEGRQQPPAHWCLQTAAWGLLTKGCALILGVHSFAAASAGEGEKLFGLTVWIPASKIPLRSDTQVTPCLSKITSA